MSPWVIRDGYGKHVPRKPGVRFPFDVVSPAGQAWIKARWADTVRTLEEEPHRPMVVQAREALDAFVAGRLCDLNVQGRLLWLRDHFLQLTDTEIAKILDVSQQFASTRSRIQEAQRRSRTIEMKQELPDLGKVRLSYRDGDDA